MAPSVNMPFIVSTDKREVDPETRKLIRSHVMRGKNRIKIRQKPRPPAKEDKLKEIQSLVTNGGPNFLSTIPGLRCSDLSTVRFAEDVEPASIADVLSCEWLPHY
jgi:hypothetical protein